VPASPFPALRTLRIRLADARLLWLTLRSSRVDPPRAWRRGQLLFQLDRLPLPALALPCPRCGAAGDRGLADDAPGCPGDCCRVCDFCLGYRWFRRAELRLRRIVADRSDTADVSFSKTSTGTKSVEAAVTRQRELRDDTTSSSPCLAAPTSPLSFHLEQQWKAGRVSTPFPIARADVQMLRNVLASISASEHDEPRRQHLLRELTR
jgi:hypothetical protein